MYARKGGVVRSALTFDAATKGGGRKIWRRRDLRSLERPVTLRCKYFPQTTWNWATTPLTVIFALSGFIWFPTIILTMSISLTVISLSYVYTASSFVQITAILQERLSRRSNFRLHVGWLVTTAVQTTEPYHRFCNHDCCGTTIGYHDFRD